MEVYNLFWTETFWFPEGKSWKDLQNNVDNNIYLPRAIDLHWALPIGLFLLFVRYVFERYGMLGGGGVVRFCDYLIKITPFTCCDMSFGDAKNNMAFE